MKSELHERARLLVDRSVVEGVSPEEQRWLASHISQCPECSQYAELSGRTIRALDSFGFNVDPAAAFRVQQTIRNRADRMTSHRRDFSIGILVAIVLTIVGSIVMWELASRWSLPAPAWQIGFSMFWLLPSVVLDVLLLFREKWMSDRNGGEGDTI